MKRLHFIASAVLTTSLLAGSVWLSANDKPMQHVRKDRALRTEQRKAPSAPKHTPIMGGTNQDKQLYGLCYASEYGGPLLLYKGPAEIHSDGEHVALLDGTIKNETGCYHDGNMMVVSMDDSKVTYTDYSTADWFPTGGSVSLTRNNPDILPQCLTYDPETKKMFGCFYTSATEYSQTEAIRFGYINTADPFNYISIVGDMSASGRAMAAAADGTVYVIGFDAKLYTVNKQTAELTELGDINLPEHDGDNWGPWYWGHESAVVEWESGLIYFNYSNSEGDTFIVTINPQTLEVNEVANFGYWSGGTENCDLFSALWFNQSLGQAQTGTPVDVTDFSVTAVGVDAAGHIKFTMPATTTEGGDLTADLSWSVSDGTTELAGGTAAPGSTVEQDVPTGDKLGQVNFVLTVSNGDLKATPVNKIVFIGPDTPRLFNAPEAMADGSSVTIAWDAMEAVNGGNLAQPQTYRIVRNPGNVVLAEDCSDTEYTDQLPELRAKYSYTVYPKAGEIIGEGRSTREMLAGTVLPVPHVDSFTDELWFRGYPVIDNNHDGNTWWVDVKRGAAVYSSNRNAADDYLLIGPIRCTAGSLYTMSMVIDGHNTVESAAAYVGTDPADVSTFSYNIIPNNWVNPSQGERRLEGAYRPEADGLYYFAIKATSGANMSNLYVYEVRIDEILNNCPAAPAAVSYKAEDASSVTLTFTLPDKTIAGEATEVSSALIYRDNALIATLTEGVSAGATLSYRDTAPGTTGMHNYRVVAVNANGQGEAASLEAYAGLDVPGSPRNLRIVEDLNDMGRLHLTWEAPAAGLHGGYIDPAGLTYYIDYTSNTHGRGEAVTDNAGSYDLVLPNVTAQGIIAASVYAGNASGASRESWITKSCYYGPALSLPLRESWPNCTQRSGQWLGQSLVEKPALFESAWEPNDGSRTGLTAQDNDGGMMLESTTVAGRGQRLLSPRVDISNVANPTLVFYHYYTSAIQDFEVGIIIDDQPVQPIRSLDLPAEGANKWYRVEVPLNQYKGAKYINLAFTGRAKVPAAEFTCIDNVSITDFVSKDLMVTDFTLPVKTDINKAITATLTVRNAGSNHVAAADYSISLYKNGNKVAEQQGQDIEADALVAFYLEDIPVVTDPAECTYYAVIEYSGDANPANNTSATRSCRVVTPVFPRVTDLEASNTDGVTLRWSDPDAADMPATPTTESFEGYPDFAIANLGSWTMHDGDGKPTVILAMDVVGQLEYEHIGEPMAWQVINPAEANIFNAAWTPRSGSKMLVSFQACNDGARNVESDDWLISPELNGRAAELSFYARAGMKAYSPELLDIMYSTTGNAVSDFVALERNVDVNYTADWTEFVYQLPEGARYFAIVHKSYNKLAVLLDDITYTPAGSVAESLELQGYNIYRDGVKINTEPVTENEYVDTEVAEGTQASYNVTALWDKGESGLSNTAVIVANRLNTIGTYKLTVTAANRNIHIEGGVGETVRVYNAAGMLVAARTVTDTADIAVNAPGMYMVQAGGKTVKLIVR